MKKLKKILYLLLFVFIFPFASFGCGEVSFDDIPYSESLLTSQEVVAEIDNARIFMISSLELRVKIETVNTYNFFATTDEKIFNSTVKDVITTTIANSKSNPAVSTVNFVRYINGEKVYRELKTYVRTMVSASEYVSYCYTLVDNYNEDGDVVSLKNRATYDSGYYDFSRLFNEALVVSYPAEIDKIYSKDFEGTKYYKLESVLAGREVSSDRFKEDLNIQENPSLFKTLNSDMDSLTNFSYEYGVNGFGYLISANLSYSLENEDRERFLNVYSTSKVKAYGDKVSVLKQPEDIDDYTSQTFMSNMNKEESFIVYKNSLASDHIKTTVAKLGTINPDYAVKVENYQVGSATSTNYYYFKYDEQSSSKYQCYLISNTDMTYTKDEKVLELIGFNFNNTFTSKNENVYQFGENLSYIKVTMENNEVSKIETKQNEQDVTLFVDSYGEDISYLGLLTLEGRVEVDSGEAN